MTPFQEATVLYDCFIRAVGLPHIYSNETVAQLIEMLEAERGQNEPGETVMIDHYIKYLQEVVGI